MDHPTDEEVNEIRALVNKTISGARRNPGEQIVLVASSPSILTSSKDVNLVIDERAEIVDAAITPKGEVTQAMVDKGYDELPMIELDVTGSQYRTLKKFAKTLEKTEKLRPKKRQRAKRAANPDVTAAKSRCMRG